MPLVVKFPGQTDSESISSLASLTQFPDAVTAAVNGDVERDAFVPDGPVVGMTYGLTADKQLRARALRYCDDITAFDDESRVVYEEGKEHPQKYITWGQESVTVEIRNAQTSYKTNDGGRERVNEAFESISDAGVREEAEGMESVDDTTYNRLEDLGYV